MRGVMGEEDIGKMAEKISSQIWSFSFDDLRVKFDLDCVSSVNIGCDSVSSFNIGFDRESCVKVSVLVKFEIN